MAAWIGSTERHAKAILIGEQEGVVRARVRVGVQASVRGGLAQQSDKQKQSC